MFALAKAPEPSACRKDMVAPGQSCHEMSIRLNKPYKTCIAVWLRQLGPQFFDWMSWCLSFTHLCLHDLLTHQGADAWWNHLGTPYRHGHEMSLDKTFGGHWVLRIVSDCCINSWSIFSKGKAILKLKLCTKTVAASYGNRWKFLYVYVCIVSTVANKTWTPNETPECNMNVQCPKKSNSY